MRPKDMTPEQFKAHRAAIDRKWRRKDGARIRERKRMTYRGTNRDWWILACRKAGVNV